MHVSEPEPFDLGLRLRSEPSEIHRFEVARGARGAGHPIRDLPLGESAWISFVIRDGEPIGPRGSTVIEPGDEVVVLAGEQHAGALRRLFQDRNA
jgi:cell volume regulation protein A